MPPLGCTAEYRPCKWVFAPLFKGCSQEEELFIINTFSRSNHTQPRAALGESAGLVHDQRVHVAQNLDRFGVPEQHAGGRATAAPTMIDMGVARPRAHGQAMISTATALISA